MVPEGQGDSENRGGTTLESVAECGNTQTRGRLSFLSDGVRRMRGPETQVQPGPKPPVSDGLWGHGM